jgi:hypothetical protein
MNERRPAWASESVLLRFEQRPTIDELTPRWAFDGATGEGVRVAVVDSGVDADHPLLGGCVDADDGIVFEVDGTGAVVATPGPHGDVFGHGTACAGIIHHLAPKARITSVRVLGANLSGKAAAFHAGLEWAIEQGFDVINLSLGTTKRDWALAFHEICDRAYFSNSFVVTAANNVMRTSYPSLFSSVASVACNTTTDPHRFHANPNPPTEFLARGIDVEVAWMNGETTRSTGNSYAAPHIAGLAALIRSKHPDLRPFQVKTVLWATAANVRDPGTDAEAAGRRGTSFGTITRATSMRGTSMRGTSMGGTSMRGTSVRGASAPEGAAASGHRPIAPEPVSPSTPAMDPAVHRATIRPAGVRPVGASGTGADEGIAAASGRLAAVAALAHPHLAMAPPEGSRPVATAAADEPVLGPWRAAAVVAVADAVGALALAGLVHGDLAMSDVVIAPSGRLAVTGVERWASAQGGRVGRTMSVAAMRHLAPEQLRDEPVTAAIDVHAVAVLATELITGRSPWPAVDRVGDLLRQRLGERPIAVASIDPAVPAALATVLDRALDPDPRNRQESADDLARELAAVLAEVHGAEPLAAAGPLDEHRLTALLAAGRPTR